MQVKCYTLTMEKDGSISANAVYDISSLSRADVYVGTAAGAKLARCGVARIEELEGRGVLSRIRVLVWVHAGRSSRRSACKMMSLADVDVVCAEFGMDARLFTVERYAEVFGKFIRVAIASGKSLQGFCDLHGIDDDTIRRFYTGGKIHAMRKDTAQKLAQITGTSVSEWPPATAACRPPAPAPSRPPTCHGCRYDKKRICAKIERVNTDYTRCVGYE